MFQKISTWPEWVGEIMAIVGVKKSCERQEVSASVVCRQNSLTWVLMCSGSKVKTNGCYKCLQIEKFSNRTVLSMHYQYIFICIY